MASIERTAYPRFKASPTATELHDIYTPTPPEAGFLAATARGPASLLCLGCSSKPSSASGTSRR